MELDDIRANLVNANTSVIGAACRTGPVGALIDPTGRKDTVQAAQTGERPVHFCGTWQTTPIYWRDHLPVQFTLPGPAIVQQMDTTLLIEPGDVATGDADGNIIIAIGGRT